MITGTAMFAACNNTLKMQYFCRNTENNIISEILKTVKLPANVHNIIHSVS